MCVCVHVCVCVCVCVCVHLEVLSQVRHSRVSDAIIAEVKMVDLCDGR